MERKDITIFRFDSESGEWNSFTIKNALVHQVRGIHEGFRGVKYNGQTVIRLKLHNPEDVYCGDKIVIGRLKGDCPSDAMTVISVTDNCRGTSFVRHIKIVCEG